MVLTDILVVIATVPSVQSGLLPKSLLTVILLEKALKGTKNELAVA